MSLEVPEHIGELSHYAMQQALDKVDAALADAPEDEPLLMRRGPWTEAPTGGGGD